MPRKSTVNQVDQQEIVFKKVASGFFWNIRSCVLSSMPEIKLNLTAIESIEVDYSVEGDYPAYIVYLVSGKIYKFSSPDQVKDIYCGLDALKKFVHGK